MGILAEVVFLDENQGDLNGGIKEVKKTCFLSVDPLLTPQYILIYNLLIELNCKGCGSVN
jgi:hypothetical protein